MILSEFITRLERANELIRIPTEVRPILEITEITDRVTNQKNGGKALLFEKTGTSFKLLINAFGSEKRMKIAFGNRSPEDLAEDVTRFMHQLQAPGTGFGSMLRKLPIIGNASRWMPRRLRRKGSCQAIVQLDPDLSQMPVLTCWPFDGGPFITLPLVHTVDPISHIPNLGMYRMQVFNRNSTGMHWHMHKTGARHYQAYKDLNRLMPVAVALGGDPVYSYCATAPLPDGVDEYLLAGFIRNKAVRMVKCITQDIWVPEDCDFVLEGFVDPSESLTSEGPFGDHTGFYSLEDQYPVFHLTAITHRQDAVYPATIVGIPPQEDSWLARATEKMFLPMIRFAMVPEIVDFHMPFEGVAHNLVLTKIKANYPGQGRKVLHTLWGAGQMMFTKFSVIVSSDGPSLTEYVELIRHISSRVDPSKHIEIASGPLDILDHSSRIPAFGGKLGIDSTGPELFFNNPSKIIEERQLMTFLSANPSITDINLEWVAKGVSLGIISIRKTYPGAVKDLQDEIRLADGLNRIRFWILFDDGVNIRKDEEVVWLACSNTEITSDVRIFSPTIGLNTGLLFIDATVKTFDLDGFNRPWPNLTLMNPETIRMVDQRWDEYQIGEYLPSRSLQHQKSYFPGAVRHYPPNPSHFLLSNPFLNASAP